MPALWTSDALAQAVGGDCSGPFSVDGISIDSRRIKKGDLFIALQGDHRDGHMFIERAAEAGAAAALVATSWPGAAQCPIPIVAVEDTFQALWDLARAARQRSRGKIAAITGSVGKTGAKEGVALALSRFGRVHKSEGNLNNQFGAPLSLARMPAEADFGVFELGMDHAGEIEPMSRLVEPDVVLITTISPVHIEFFDSILGIADAKSEIFQGLKLGGVAVLPRDNPLYHHLSARAEEAGVGHISSFGAHPEADFRLHCATPAAHGQHVRLVHDAKILAYRLSAIGEHRAMNSAAVLAVVGALGLDIEKAAQGLIALTPGEGRGAVCVGRLPKTALSDQGGPITVIDESYNASPVAVKAAIKVLAAMPLEPPGRRILVLGDMLELGDFARTAHAGLAQDVKDAKIDLVFTCGPLSAALHNRLPEERRGAHARDSAELAPLVLKALRPNDVITVKGSLGSRMKPIVELLTANAAEPVPEGA